MIERFAAHSDTAARGLVARRVPGVRPRARPTRGALGLVQHRSILDPDRWVTEAVTSREVDASKPAPDIYAGDQAKNVDGRTRRRH